MKCTFSPQRSWKNLIRLTLWMSAVLPSQMPDIISNKNQVQVLWLIALNLFHPTCRHEACFNEIRPEYIQQSEVSITARK